MVSPCFLIKLTTFLNIALWKVMPFLAVVSSPLPSSHLVYPAVLSKFSHKNNCIRVSPSWIAIRPLFPSHPIVTPLAARTQMYLLLLTCTRFAYLTGFTVLSVASWRTVATARVLVKVTVVLLTFSLQLVITSSLRHCNSKIVQQRQSSISY